MVGLAKIALFSVVLVHYEPMDGAQYKATIYACMSSPVYIERIRACEAWIHEEEENSFTDVVKSRPYLHMGIAYKEYGYTERALMFLEESIRLHPSKPAIDARDELLKKTQNPAQ